MLGMANKGNCARQAVADESRTPEILTDEALGDEDDSAVPLLALNEDDRRHAEIDDRLESQPKETPIPWRQLSIVLVVQFCERLTTQVLNPFVPQLIREIGVTDGDDTKVGYYVGLMQSTVFAAQALTTFHWSRLSDTVGRKPVVLIGLFGLSASMYSFGLSRTFVAVVVSRSLAVMLNGNLVIMKSMVAELSDETNIARAYAYQPIAWSVAEAIGPLIGGTLSRPADRFPWLFGQSNILKMYPYFLPCAIPATMSAIAWFVSFYCLVETNPSGVSLIQLLFGRRVQPSHPQNDAPRATAVPLSALLTPRLLIAMVNYALLCFVGIALRALQPVFFATPTALGGLGLSPSAIGTCFSLAGIVNGFFQIFLFADLHRRAGSRTLYLVGIAATAPIFALFPLMRALVARSGGNVGPALWAAVATQLALGFAMNMCFNCIFIFVTAAAPGRRALGATNGLAQLTASVVRSVGPTLTNWLFSRSLAMEYEEGKGGAAGFLVYGVLLVLVGLAIAAGAILPREPGKRAMDSE